MTHKEFYKTKAWQRCRDAYIESVSGLCEDCLAKGIFTPAVIVHHKIHLDDRNINDPDIALAFKNLRAVCRQCHGAAHQGEKFGGRYAVDALGNLVELPP